ncbi:MAG: hypothetical protein MJ050_03375 [Phascolarctobacterium sp.]|nr:hypothetical protein [Phascolarctobacterium sp.]
MDFSFFVFLVFMSLVSFALAFLAYYFVVRIFGKDTFVSRMVQIIGIPLVIVAYDMFVFYVDDSWRYFVASIPLAAVVGLALYGYFFKGGDAEGFLSTPQEAAKAQRILEAPAKKPSKKSQRIHEARKKRGKE